MLWNVLRQHFSNNINNSKGSALILALVLLVIFMMLGSAMLGYAVSEAKLSTNTYEYVQAYYIARAGAEVTADWMINHPDENKIGDDTNMPTPFGGGTITKVKVYYLDNSKPYQPNGVIIESTGEFGSAKRTVKLSMTENYTFIPQSNMAAFANDQVNIGGGSILLLLDKTTTINGDIGTNSDIPRHVFITPHLTFDSNIYIGPEGDTGCHYPSGHFYDENAVVHIRFGGLLNELVNLVLKLLGLDGSGTPHIFNLNGRIYYPEPAFPSIPDLTHAGELTLFSNRTISNDAHYARIKTNGHTLTVNCNGGRTLVVDDLNLSNGSIKLTNTNSGGLQLYVTNSLTVGSKPLISILGIVLIPGGSGYVNKGGSPSNLNLYYYGSTDFQSVNDSMIYGNIYIKNANAQLQDTLVVGSIVAGGTSIELQGSGSRRKKQKGTLAIYAPKADVLIHDNDSLISVGGINIGLGLPVPDGVSFIDGAIISNNFTATDYSVLIYNDAGFPPIMTSRYFTKGNWQ